MSRSQFFLRLWGHVIVWSCVGGGAVVAIGCVIGTFFSFASVVVAVIAIPVACVVGTVFGVVFGLVAATVGALSVYPYPGRWTVMAFGRTTGILAGLAVDAIPVAFLAASGSLDFRSLVSLWLFLPPIVGWWLGQRLMDWYIEAVDGDVRFA